MLNIVIVFFVSNFCKFGIKYIINKFEIKNVFINLSIVWKWERIWVYYFLLRELYVLIFIFFYLK